MNADGILIADLWKDWTDIDRAKNKKRYLVRVRDPAARRYDSKCFTALEEAEQWGRHRRKEFVERRATAARVSWKELGDNYATVLRGIPASVRHIQQVEQVAAALHAAGARDITDHNFPDIAQRWLAGLRARRPGSRSYPASPSLKIKFLVIAKSIVQTAVDRGTPLYNPLTIVRMPRQPKGLKAIFLPNEMAELVADSRRADPWWWYAVLGAYTGQRSATVRAMRKRHFRPDADEAIFPANLPGNKAQRDIRQGVQIELRALLAELPDDDKPILELVSPRLLKMTESGLSHGFQDYVERCGLDAKGRGFHALRHSVAAHLCAMGMSPHLVASWLGHETESVTRDYSKNAERVRIAVQGWPLLEGFRFRRVAAVAGPSPTSPHQTASQ